MSNKANEVLDEVVKYCNEELSNKSTPSEDAFAFGRKEMALSIVLLISKSRNEPDKDERKAMEELEQELLSGSRYCINGDCEG